ncbi:MAG: N-formylglutamate amidohydrolase, partial [Gemmatimonadota bacterium]
TDEFSLDLARAGEPWGTLVRARAARLVIDVNRSGTVSPIDLSDDPAHERDRLVRLYDAEGRPLWRTRPGQPYLGRPELEDRIRRYHEPFHRALAAALEAAPRPRVLVDVHSVSWPAFDVVLGDFRGRSAGAALCESRLQPLLEEHGLKVAYAGPRPMGRDGRPVAHDAVRYSGGFITARYGDPGRGQLALQVELSRQTCRLRFPEVRAACGALFGYLAEGIRSGLLPGGEGRDS